MKDGASSIILYIKNYEFLDLVGLFSDPNFAATI